MRLLLIAALCILHSAFAAARVVRVDVTSRSDYWNGTYERIVGRVTYALDPANPHNKQIVDLTQPVEFSGDLDMVRPKNGGNGVLYVNVPNRGGRFFVRDSNPDEWYLRQGFTLAEVAWQFDVRPDARLMHFDAPVAKGIRGHVRSDFIVGAKTFDHPVAHVIQGNIGGTGYPAADTKDAVLTERDAPMAPRRTIPSSKWRFVDPKTIHLDDGFVPEVFDPEVLDRKLIVRPRESIEWTRRLTEEASVFAGISTGAALAGAAKAAAQIDTGVIVTLSSDGGWKYLSTGAWTDDIDDVVERAEKIVYF